LKGNFLKLADKALECQEMFVGIRRGSSGVALHLSFPFPHVTLHIRQDKRGNLPPLNVSMKLDRSTQAAKGTALKARIEGPLAPT
jgi:hypothetical protein